MPELRIVVAEDDVLVSRGVVALLEVERDFEIVGTADDMQSLLAAVAQFEPDVVLTDIRMPPSHTDEGIQAAIAIAEQHPRVGVVVLSQYDDPGYAVRLLSAGSGGRGYLLKERVTSADLLYEAIRTVAAGGTHVDQKVIDRLVQGRISPLKWLTPREIQVLAEMAQGRDNRAIAEALSIGLRSVEKHINSIFAKLGLSAAVGVSPRVAAVITYLQDDAERP